MSGRDRIDSEPIGDEVICPWCNHEHRDSWDYGWGDHDHAEIDCEECGNAFEAYRNVTISYSSHRPKGSRQ